MSERDTCLVCCRPLASEEERGLLERQMDALWYGHEEEWDASYAQRYYGPLCMESWDLDHPGSGFLASSVVWGVISLALWARKACRGVPRAPDPSCEEGKGGGRMIVWFNNTDGDETDCTCTVRR